MDDPRLTLAKKWLAVLPFDAPFEVAPLAGDASFRRYFRVASGEQTFVLMDAPPEKEDTTPFTTVDLWLQKIGINVPEILHVDKSLGFLLLQDFGDTTWSKHISKISNKSMELDGLFKNALQQLYLLQSPANTTPAKPVQTPALPDFNTARMNTEIQLYLDWYLPHIKSLIPTETERNTFLEAMRPHLQAIADLPKVPVHLDYHSRNLMVPQSGLPLGVIDFQDAVLGPITYDLASLLYDCYQDYPEALRRKWSKYFYLGLNKQHQSYFSGFETWHKALRLTSLQRHVKVLGIFARLAFRDGKTQFLDEIPLTHKHFVAECQALSIKLPF